MDGAYSRWLGRGDLHDIKYDDYEVRTTINSIVSGEDEDSYNPTDYVPDVEDRGFLYYDCLYNIRVYPSEEFEERYKTSKPMRFAVILASLFAFTITVFIFYHKAVERRQKLVLQSALQSGQLVSSLYPEEIRKRLYAEQRTEEESQSRDGVSPWFKTSSDKTEEEPSNIEKKAAIATLYPEATVLFIDIVGFTKWSSQRTPSEVFELLEALYGAFDKAARRRGVFKVETIGGKQSCVIEGSMNYSD